MEKTVMAFGSFDILHPGHLTYLRSARKLGTRLIVVVARDSSIALFKGRKPFFNEKERLMMVSALRIVDKAVLGNRIKRPEETFAIIKEFMPDLIALGYDQRADARRLRQYLLSNAISAKVVRIRSRAKRSRYRSSAIRRAMR